MLGKQQQQLKELHEGDDTFRKTLQQQFQRGPSNSTYSYQYQYNDTGLSASYSPAKAHEDRRKEKETLRQHISKGHGHSVLQYMQNPWQSALTRFTLGALGMGVLSGLTLPNVLAHRGPKQVGWAIAGLSLAAGGLLGFTGLSQTQRLNERYKHMIALNSGDPNTTLAQGKALMQAHGEDATSPATWWV